MEDKDLLLGRMDDLAGKAVKEGFAASRFLTPAEAQSVSVHLSRRHDVALSFDGGYEDAERTRAVFLTRGEYDRAGLFTALKIAYHPRDTLGHRDILGALMALGIERDTVGDIRGAEHCFALVCLPELGGYIAENLTKAGRAGITVSEIGLEDLPAGQEALTVKTDTVASVRLDAALCAAFGLSRTKAAELVAAGRVNLDHQICLQPAKELTGGALLSIRGLGRAKLLEIGGLSKKGRIFIKIGLYGR